MSGEELAEVESFQERVREAFRRGESQGFHEGTRAASAEILRLQDEVRRLVVDCDMCRQRIAWMRWECESCTPNPKLAEHPLASEGVPCRKCGRRYTTGSCCPPGNAGDTSK